MGTTQSSTESLSAQNLRVAVLVSRYNPKIGEGLLAGALAQWAELGGDASQLSVFRVPGAFELPFFAKQLAQTGDYDALLCLGAVIRGETTHYDYVCQGATQGLMQAMLETGVPMAFGVLTTENEAQALARSSDNEHNKGREAARTAVEMALKKKAI